MTTSTCLGNRGQEIGEFVVGDEGPIEREVRLVADKALTKSEVLILMRRVKERLLQIDIPRV